MWSLLGKKISGFSVSFEGTSQYQIIELLGAGGMGSVYKAKLKGVNGFEKIVAIKTLLDKYTNDPKFVARFIEEAKMVANLIHENIVPENTRRHASRTRRICRRQNRPRTGIRP